MCFSSGNQAQQQAQQQQSLIDQQAAARNSAISEGKGNIDKAFSQFDNGYFQKYRDAYKDRYNPQLDQQYGIARDKLTAALAGRGMEGSTTGANKFAQTSKTYNDAQAEIGDSAANAANGLRSNLDQTKSNLYGLNISAADPAMAAAQAQAAVGSVPNPALGPNLSNIFGAALGPLANANNADRTSMNPQFSWNKLASGPGNAHYG